MNTCFSLNSKCFWLTLPYFACLNPWNLAGCLFQHILEILAVSRLYNLLLLVYSSCIGRKKIRNSLKGHFVLNKEPLRFDEIYTLLLFIYCWKLKSILYFIGIFYCRFLSSKWPATPIFHTFTKVIFTTFYYLPVTFTNFCCLSLTFILFSPAFITFYHLSPISTIFLTLYIFDCYKVRHAASINSSLIVFYMPCVAYVYYTKP